MGCNWWILNIVVSDKTVTFYVGITGNSWSMALKNYNGTVEASKGGSSYGTHSLTATTYDTPQTPHRLELTCNWSIPNPCEVCNVNIPTPAQANIAAIDITVTPDDPCVEGICIVNVSVTWQNTGDIEGSFVPNISINGIPITPIYQSEQLGAGSTTTHTFTVSGLTKVDSPYSICPDPN